MKSIFPGAIDGDLLKLVHLSNSFRTVEGAKPLQVGDICRPEARIVSVTNSSEGKIVKVKGHCYRNNQPVIEVIHLSSIEVVSSTTKTLSTLLRSLITSFI
jgi:fatty acid synthase subunit alpha